MKSKVAQRILDTTPKEVHKKLSEFFKNKK
jgi:hypothetical protein